MEQPKFGKIMWADLTVEDATAVSEFYKEVVGWDRTGLSMGDYEDYVMTPEGTEDGVAGICHARGGNVGLPAQWLPYVTVANLDRSLEQCVRMGGKVLGEKRKMGPDSTYCLIQDPAGAYMMLCGE